MIELRCWKCGKLLGFIEGKVEIKCTRCKEINKFDTEKEYQKSANESNK